MACRSLPLLALVLIPHILPAQEKSEFQQILERLDRLETENRNLSAEVHALRDQLAASRGAPASQQAPPAASAANAPQPSATPSAAPSATPLDERVAVNERRIDELAQTKVESSQKLPVSLTGMVLFNSFLNGKGNGGFEDPLAASSRPSQAVGGASLAQSVIGLTFRGPQIFGGGRVSGSLYMDLWAGSSSSLNHTLRLRTGTVQIDWKNQTLTFGQDKPLISPRDPTSLAQVAFSPLTGAGNLWLWQPQVRFEQRVGFGEDAGLRAQIGVYETGEPSSGLNSEYSGALSPSRPALEGRFELWRRLGKSGRIEIAPGFHTSTSHVLGFSVPSHLFSLDWFVQPVSKVQITGMFFDGQNVAGLGGLQQGFTVLYRTVLPVRAAGGWTQFSYLATKRLTFNVYSGQESDHPEDLAAGEITRNFVFAGNAIYRLGSNVLLGLEAAQIRTLYLAQPNRHNNHYDLALGYLF